MGKEARRKRNKRNKQKKTEKRPASTGKIVELDGETAIAMREQLAAFERRFGRAAGPDDPVFFDPDFDVPTPITAVKAEAAIVEGLRAAGADPAYVYAVQHTGLLLTEANVDKVSDADRSEWSEAINRYHQIHDRPVAKDEIRAMMTQLAVFLVDLVLNDDGRTFFATVDALPSQEDDGLTVALLFGTFAGWLVGAREQPTVDDATIEEAVVWASARVGRSGTDAVEAVAGLLRRNAVGTMNEMFEQVNDDRVMVVSLAILAAGLAVALRCESADELLAVIEPDE